MEEIIYDNDLSEEEIGEDMEESLEEILEEMNRRDFYARKKE